MNRTMKQIGLAVFVLALCGAGMALAAPGEGVRIGNLIVSPFLDLSMTYDSNVYLTRPDEEDDIFSDIVGGVAFVNKTERLILAGRGWGQFRRYADATDKNSDGYGEKLNLVWGNERKLSLAVGQKFVRLDDYELTPRSVDTLNLPSQLLLLTEDRTERVDRKLFDISPVLRYLPTDKTELDVGYSYNSVGYKDDTLYDWYENRGQVEATHKITDKTAGLVTLQYSQQNSDSFQDPSTYYIVRGGVLQKVTAKTTVKAGVGVQDYNFGQQSSTGDNLDKTMMNFDVIASWQATDKLSFEASGRNAIQPATQYSANTKEVVLASVGVGYDVTDHLTFTLAGSYREDDYIGRVETPGGLRNKRRDLVGGRARLDYRPHVKFCNVFVETTYEDVDDTVEDDYNDYDQWRVSGGVSLRY